MDRMPALFLAHGSPMNAIEDNIFTRDWLQVAGDLGQPQGIVVFSAHWETTVTEITASPRPPTLHDFSGFPDALNKVHYPCPGSPEIASELHKHLLASGFKAILNHHRGLDHGSWAILHRLFPLANIPVLQISLSTRLADPGMHFKLARSLRTFRDQNILFIGSGNHIHNIPLWLSMHPNDSFQWALEFDQAVYDAIEEWQPERLFDVKNLPFSRLAVPTLEHYLPLIYTLGLAFDRHEGRRHSIFNELSMASICSRSLRIG